MNETINTPLLDSDTQNVTYVDLHTHTLHSAFNEGVYHSSDEAVRTAKERGLGGLAITGHDTFKGLQEAMEAGEKHGIIVIPGVEITTRSVHRGRPRVPHLIGLFPPEEALRLERSGQRAPSLRRPKYVANWIRERGGVVIAPHPKPKGNVISLSYKQVERLEGLHAIETHNKSGENSSMMELARQRGLASVGASDAHHPGEIGVVKTIVLGLCETVEDVLEAIRRGNVQGVIDNPLPTEFRGPRTVGKLLGAYMDRVRDKISR